jgi:hypothetical protein
MDLQMAPKSDDGYQPSEAEPYMNPRQLWPTSAESSRPGGKT